MSATGAAPDGHTPRRGVWRIALVGVVAVLVTVGVLLQAVGPMLPPGWGAPGVAGLWAVGFTTVGAAIARQRSGHTVGWRLLLAGLFAAFLYVALETANEVGRLPAFWTDLAGVTASWSWALAAAPMATAILRFPTGDLPSRRWRFVEPTLWGVVAVFGLASAFGPAESALAGARNPFEIPGAAPVLRPLSVDGGVVYLPLQLLLSACIAAPFARLRRSSGLQRQQLRLLGLAGSVAAVTIFVIEVVIGRLVMSTGFVNPTWITSLVVLLLPAAMGVAILRHRLYDIDRLISRTVTYAMLTAVLVAVYAGSVVVLQALVRPVTGSSDLAVAGSTLAVAAVFGPARRRVQRLVDRRFNRRRYDAARAAERFGYRLRDEVDLDEVAAELRATVGRTVQPASLSLWLAPGEETS